MLHAALHAFAVRRQAREIVTALDSVPMDFGGSGDAWGYGGDRDLSALERDARAPNAA